MGGTQNVGHTRSVSTIANQLARQNGRVRTISVCYPE